MLPMYRTDPVSQEMLPLATPAICTGVVTLVALKANLAVPPAVIVPAPVVYGAVAARLVKLYPLPACVSLVSMASPNCSVPGIDPVVALLGDAVIENVPAAFFNVSPEYKMFVPFAAFVLTRK